MGGEVRWGGARGRPPPGRPWGAAPLGPKGGKGQRWPWQAL